MTQQAPLELAIKRATEFLRAGRLQEADALARQVLGAAPEHPAALHCLGLLAQRSGRSAEAMDLIRRAIAGAPLAAEYHYNISTSLQALGRLDEAEQSLREAIRLRPELASAHLNLGALLFGRGRLEEAIVVFQTARRLQPGDPRISLNLGKALRWQGKLDEAEEAIRQAIAYEPTRAAAHNMLASCLRDGGRIAEAIQSYHVAVTLDPNYREAHSNLCFAMYFDPEATPQATFDEHLAWARKFARPQAQSIAPPQWANDRSTKRRLRIGYVSPNLRFHVVGFFMQPILEHHDRARFEIVCYDDATIHDEMAPALKAHADLWRETAAISDVQLAALIRQDRIDILIDLNLHMRGSRLRAFAQRPAPVQITHLAYCGTSGLRAMDGCIADVSMLAPGCERYFTERLLPLPKTYWCYRPSPSAPPVAEPPVLSNGYITFGSLNSLAKIHDQVARLWSRLLDAVPNSRLAVQFPGGSSTRSILDRFASNGIPEDRIERVPRSRLNEYLAMYHRIDVALDSFPYGGGTTTLDALWMGVPVITLAGQMPLGRAGVSILTNAGLTDLIASSPDQYIQIAAGLAADQTRLSDLRSTLRDRLRSSPLMDEAGYVGALEGIYREAWKRWCTGA